jgi:hypothetical protein
MNVHSGAPRSTYIAFCFAKLALPLSKRGTHNTFTKSDRAKNHRGIDLIFDALPFGRFTVTSRNGVSNAIDHATF